MRIHPEGRGIVGVAGIAGLLVSLGFWVWLPRWAAFLLTIGIGVGFLFILQFFRDPKRRPPNKDNILVAPADGKVVVDETVFEREYLKSYCRQISIFMGPFDVHQNRLPVAGRLVYYQYHPGQYLAAYKPKSSELNEQNTIAIETAYGPLVMRQIAGVMARRIRFYLEKGKHYPIGTPLGFIRFGSRMDLFLPREVELEVSLGTQVYAGKSILAYWP